MFLQFCLLLSIFGVLSVSQDSADQQQEKAFWVVPDGSDNILSQSFMIGNIAQLEWAELDPSDTYIAQFTDNPVDLWLVSSLASPQLLTEDVSLMESGGFNWSVSLDVELYGPLPYSLEFKTPTLPPSPRNWYNLSNPNAISSPVFWVVPSNSSSSSTSASSAIASATPLSPTENTITATPSNPSSIHTTPQQIALAVTLSLLGAVLAAGLGSWAYIYTVRRRRTILYESHVNAKDPPRPDLPPPMAFAWHQTHPLRVQNAALHESVELPGCVGWHGEGSQSAA